MGVRFLTGDVFDMLATLPDETIDCVVTSPPYWGLRDYGAPGQIGLEPTLGEHLDVMVRVFAEVRRVLKPTGTCWVNYGDCYAAAPNGRSAADTKAAGNDDRTFRDKPFSTVGPVYEPREGDKDRRGKSGNKGNGDRKYHSGRIVAGGFLKPKDLCMVPNRFAIAMQEFGWWVRSEIIWAKPNPMPESIKDRPATAHEKIFLFTKSARYFYDAEAVRQEAVKTGTIGHVSAGRNSRVCVRRTPTADKQRGHGRRHAGFNDRWDAMSKAEQQANGRNLRNYEPAPAQVWNIATRAFKEAHFATFPPELVQRCLDAGCPKGGHVLDPFGGAGTTGLVADRMQRDATLIEIKPEYVEIARRRIASDAGALFADASHGDDPQEALL